MGLRMPERLSGAVYGHLVGDALGVPYESAGLVGTIEWRGHGSHGQPPGTWSDDGALMLALLDSLLPDRPGDAPRFDQEDQAARALAWWRRGVYACGGSVFDIGAATRRALEAIERGMPATHAGASDALGNGSLMRILPLPLVMRQVTDEELVRMAGLASDVTHGSAEARIACALYVLLVRRLLDGAALEVATEASGALAAAAGVVRAAPPGGATAADLEAFLAWPGRSGRGRVVDSFWSAWDAFAGAHDYREAVTRAVAYGNDTDTTAAIAGGMAGSRWGIDAIPTQWLHGLRDHHITQTLVDRLIETDGWRTSTGNPLRLDMLDLSGLPALGGVTGRVALTFLPGKQRDGVSGRHWRDLELDAVRLSEHYGVSALALLVEDRELEACRVERIADVLATHGIVLLRHPIDDIPGETEDLEGYGRLVRELIARVRRGETVAIACRGGLDRSGMTAGCLLREAGAEPDDAIARVQRARRGALTRPNQQAVVRRWRPG